MAEARTIGNIPRFEAVAARSARSYLRKPDAMGPSVAVRPARLPRAPGSPTLSDARTGVQPQPLRHPAPATGPRRGIRPMEAPGDRARRRSLPAASPRLHHRGYYRGPHHPALARRSDDAGEPASLLLPLQLGARRRQELRGDANKRHQRHSCRGPDR